MDKEILVERVAEAMREEVARQRTNQWSGAADAWDPHALARAAIASMPHSEQVEGASVQDLRVWRNNDVQSLMAALSLRNWHRVEQAANVLRDRIDAVLNRPKALTRNVSDKDARSDANGHSWSAHGPYDENGMEAEGFGYARLVHDGGGRFHKVPTFAPDQESGDADPSHK